MMCCYMLLYDVCYTIVFGTCRYMLPVFCDNTFAQLQSLDCVMYRYRQKMYICRCTSGSLFKNDMYT